MPPMRLIEYERQKENPAHNLDVLDARAFLRDFYARSGRAEEEVFAENMFTNTDGAGYALIRLFRRVPPHIRKIARIDAFSEEVTDGVMHRVNAWIPSVRTLIEKRKAFFAQLRSIPNTIVEIKNKPENLKGKLLPFFGRSHIKAYGVDDKFFYFGGANLDKPDLNSLDLMVTFTDEWARRLKGAYAEIRSHPQTTDLVFDISDDTQLLYDCGRRGTSSVLDKGLYMIAHAKANIKNTSALYPDGAVRTKLNNKAQEGKDVEVITATIDRPSHLLPLETGHAFWLVNQITELRRTKEEHLRVIVSKGPKVHAKLLIADDSSALFGSHNLSSAGVKAGTEEWAIFTTNPRLVSNLGRRYDEIKKKAA